MPTVAELQIVLEAQDRASAQLRTVGQAVAGLSRQVAGVSGRVGGPAGLFGGLLAGVGIAATTRALDAMGGVFDFVRDSVVTLNAELERNVAAFESLTGSAEAAADVVAALRREAATSPFSDREVIAAGRALLTVSERSTESLLGLVEVAEQLAALDPAQGLEGAAFALREALGGDFQSLIERFEVSRQAIARFRAEGMTNLQVVTAALREMGVTSEIVERLGRTFEGRVSTIRSFFDELRQLAGRGLFDRLNDLLGGVVRLIDEFGDRLRIVATGIGTALGAIAERIGGALLGPLRALLDLFAPGLFDQMLASFQRVPGAIERTGEAARQADPAVQGLERRLGGLGVAAAELSLEADRVRRRYDEQIGPLERQLRLLQQSADVQRVQNALATNRATVEGIRLEREIAALRRAARGQEDPNAPGLSLRQRMIALALQERRLRQEELGLEGERRPQMQALEQEIARLQEEQRRTLEPLERSLALRRDEIAALQLVRDQEKLLAEDVAATARRRMDGWTAQNPGALDEVRQRGEELAQSWVDGWQRWIDANGGDVMTALWRSFRRWYDEGGRDRLVALATEIGTLIGDVVAAAAGTAIGGGVRRRIEEITAGSSASQIADEVARGMFTGPGGAGASGGGGSGFGGEGMNVNVNVNGADPGVALRFRQELQQKLDEWIRGFFAAQAATDPGASPALQGSGRAP